MNRYPSRPVALQKPCWSCGYAGGLLIRRLDDNSPELIKCGSCDTYQGKFGGAE